MAAIQEKALASAIHVDNAEAGQDADSVPGVIDSRQEDDYRIGWRTVLACTSLSLANSCAALSNTTNTIIRFQVEAVGGTSYASWIGNAGFLLTLCFAPVFGFLSDRVGKKWFIVAGATLGVIGACLAGSAHTVQRIIGGQVLSGIANAGCIVSIAASQEVAPNKYRPWVMGYSQGMASAAALLGTYCAGAFVKYQSWRWSYYLNAVAYFLAATSNALAYHPPPPLLRRRGSLKEIFSGLDYVGIVLLSGSLASLVLGLTWGGTTYPWHSGAVVGPIVAGCAGLLILGLFETFFQKEGLFDHRLFADRNFGILLFVCTIDGMLLLGVNVLYSQEIAALFTVDPVRIAVILSPYLITSLFGCLPAGWLMARFKSYRVMLIGALVWCSLFTGLMALLSPARLNYAYAFSTLFGAGTAVTTVIPFAALALSVPSFLLGTAGTMSISCRALGGIIGITIFTAIHDNKLSADVPRYVTGALMSTTTLSSAGSDQQQLEQIIGLLSDPALPPPAALAQIRPALSSGATDAILAAYSTAQVDSWKWVWVAIASLVAVNALIACFTRPVGNRMDDHVESALEQSTARSNQMGTN